MPGCGVHCLKFAFLQHCLSVFQSISFHLIKSHPPVPSPSGWPDMAMPHGGMGGLPTAEKGLPGRRTGPSLLARASRLIRWLGGRPRSLSGMRDADKVMGVASVSTRASFAARAIVACTRWMCYVISTAWETDDAQKAVETRRAAERHLEQRPGVQKCVPFASCVSCLPTPTTNQHWSLHPGY